MITIFLAVALCGWGGWYFWRRYAQVRQRERDQAYWNQIRRECPGCAKR